jgi:ACR3 family arsenite efflux pump ArsB
MITYTSARPDIELSVVFGLFLAVAALFYVQGDHIVEKLFLVRGHFHGISPVRYGIIEG